MYEKPVQGDSHGSPSDAPDRDPENTLVPDSNSPASSRPASSFEGKYGTPWSERSFVYQWTPFRGMYYDVKGRLPFYVSDWTDGFKPRNLYRVVAASIRMYWINLLPALGEAQHFY